MRSIFEITEKGAFQQIAFTTCRSSCTHMNKLFERSFSNLQQMSRTILKYIFSQEPRRLSHPPLIIISKVESESERKIQNRIHEREKTSSICVRV